VEGQTKRQAAREQAFALLFEVSFHPGEHIAALVARAGEVSEPSIAPDAFALQLAETAALHLETLDSEIETHLKGWKLGRISRVSHALLRLALCEMRFFDSIPIGASINEAVELAKRYGDKEAPRFINGVLGAIARDIGGAHAKFGD
jgi:N utilization substance protein B